MSAISSANSGSVTMKLAPDGASAAYTLSFSTGSFLFETLRAW
jgi:hypothetical protein